MSYKIASFKTKLRMNSIHIYYNRAIQKKIFINMVHKGWKKNSVKRILCMLGKKISSVPTILTAICLYSLCTVLMKIFFVSPGEHICLCYSHVASVWRKHSCLIFIHWFRDCAMYVETFGVGVKWIIQIRSITQYKCIYRSEAPGGVLSVGVGTA